MSRIGKQPIPIPTGVEVKMDGASVHIKGPKGGLEWSLPVGIGLRVDGGTIHLEDKLGNTRGKALHGTSRTLVANMVTGVTQGYTRALEIIGVGYRAQVAGRKLVLNLRYDHPIEFPLPEGVNAEVTDRPLKITLRGIDKALLGQTAANIRAFQKPDPYKGKGIRYEGEQVRKKAGKSAG
jgi:large subunit ribosomal protein L6